MHSNIVIDDANKTLAPNSETRTIFFPHWIKCPYRFHVRLAWATAMDLARRKERITVRAIEEITGQSRNTIGEAIKTLAADGLCTTPSKGRYPHIELIEPPDDKKYWAAKKKGKGEGWLNLIAYTIVEFANDRPPIQSAILAKVGGLKGRQSYSGLAEMLGLDRHSVKRAVETLEQDGLLTIDDLLGGYIRLTRVVESEPLTDDSNGSLCAPNGSVNGSLCAPNGSLCAPNGSHSTTSIKGIKGIKVLTNREKFSEEEVSVTEKEKEEMPAQNNEEQAKEDERERGLRTINKRLCELKVSEPVRVKVLKLVDLLFARTETTCYLGQFATSSRYQREDVAQWFGDYYAALAKEHVERKYEGKPISLVIHRLEIAAGIKPAPKPKPKQPKQLSAAEIERKRMRREIYADEREMAALTVDLSMPWQATSA